LKEKGVFLPFLQAVNVATEHNRGVSTLGAQTQHNTTQHNTTQQNKTKQNKTKQNKTKQNKTSGVFFSCLSFHSFYVCPIPSLSY
jgi:hypothetical protein